MSLDKHEYTDIQTFDDCRRVEGEDSWDAMGQFKQRMTMIYIEQLIIEFEVAKY